MPDDKKQVPRNQQTFERERALVARLKQWKRDLLVHPSLMAIRDDVCEAIEAIESLHNAELAGAIRTIMDLPVEYLKEPVEQGEGFIAQALRAAARDRGDNGIRITTRLDPT